jgi:beta-xylosidase
VIWRNPLLPGFHPDPSVVRVGDDYFLATSSFEYLPGIPIHRSRDLVSWDLIGHVATRSGQLQMDGVPTAGGAWAPTIRWRDGTFYVVVTDALGRGTLVFTAADPAGPWSDGIVLAGVDGIDPDVAWDGDDCYLTYSGLVLGGPDRGRHRGIQQVRVDLANGRALESPRSVWSGSGLMFPEAPHLYRLGAWWYLMIAEGGTERGHAISIARARSPVGPFEPCPRNPVLSARSTDRPIQNTGHGDLVDAPDGSWTVVLLGVRTRGMTRGFSPLGRETFATDVEWVDEWPVMAPVVGEVVNAPTFADDFAGASLGPEWIGVRRFPTEVATLVSGGLTLHGEDRTMDDPAPTFVGRRQRRLDALITTRVVGRAGVGGLTIRYDEQHHYDLELDGERLVARARLPSIVHEQAGAAPAGPLELYIEMAEPDPTFPGAMTSDVIRLGYADDSGALHEVAAFEGRFLTAESACSFTGRVAGLYCTTGSMTFERFGERGI